MQGFATGEVFAFDVGNRKENGYDDGREHFEVVRFQAQQDDEIVHDVVNNSAAHNTDEADNEVGLNLQGNGQADEDGGQTDNDGNAAIVDVGRTLVLRQHCAGKDHDAVGNGKAHHLVPLHVYALGPAHVGAVPVDFSVRPISV